MSHKQDPLTELRDRVSELEAELGRAREVEETLKEQNQELAMLLRIANIFLSERLDNPLDALLEAICEELESPMGSVDHDGMKREDDLLLLPVRQSATRTDDEVKLQPPPNTWAQKARVLGKTISQESECEVPSDCIEVQRVLAVPMVFGGEVKGTLTVANRPTPYDKVDLELLESVALFTAPILESRERNGARIVARVEEQKTWAETRVARSAAFALETVLGEIETALEAGDADAKKTGDDARLKQALEHARRGQRIVRKLGAFGHRGLGSPEPFDLHRVVSKSVEDLKRRSDVDVDVTYTRSSDLDQVLGDENGFELVARELLQNALDASSRDHPIEVETVPVTLGTRDPLRPENLSPGRYGLLKVKDSGIGIDEDVQKLVFEPFFTTKKRQRGSGLGLSAIRSIISAAGGGISLESTPGVGTSIYVYLPLWHRDTSPIPVKRSELKPENVATVLVVDDEPVALKFMVGVLERTGYSVIQAVNGAAALELLEELKKPIDLLVTDIVMSPVNGPELVGRLAAKYPDLAGG